MQLVSQIGQEAASPESWQFVFGIGMTIAFRQLVIKKLKKRNFY